MEWSESGRPEHREEIGPGLLLLLGVGPSDTPTESRRLAAKVAHLRLFADQDGKTNLSLLDTGGEALVVSQFTLYADLSRGRRPSFTRAADPDHADRLYQEFAAELRQQGVPVKTGSFGARMAVTLTNDGPVTLALSSDGWPTQV